MSHPFHNGLIIVFLAAAGMMVIAAVASWSAGGKYVHDDAADKVAADKVAAGEALGRE